MNIQAIIASILAAVTGFAGGVAPTSSLPNIPFISDWMMTGTTAGTTTMTMTGMMTTGTTTIGMMTGTINPRFASPKSSKL